MNLPNKLTLGRVILAFFFLCALVSHLPFTRTVALVLFVLAAVTDWYDGELARRHQLITNFGKLMDPLADKILTAAALISFIEVEPLWVPAWMVVLVIAREFAVSGMRQLAASQGIILASERSGKHKLASQVVFVSLMLIFLAVREWGTLFFHFWPASLDLYLGYLSWILMLVVVGYAAVSGFDYFQRNWKILFKEV